jgi:hypothetical protein
MKLLGLRKVKERNYTVYKNDWLEFCTGFRKLNFTISPASYFDNRALLSFSFGWGQFYIHIPFIKSKYDESDPPVYGFYFYSVSSWLCTSFVWCWRRKRYHYDMPWNLEWVRTSRMLKDFTWLHERKGDRKKGIEITWWREETQEKLWQQTHSYTYILKDGTVQNRMATIKIEQREWRPKWFTWISLFKKVRTNIDIQFDKEVGERTGSWKGGTLGCGWDLLPNETALECLRRMEKERKFN